MWLAKQTNNANKTTHRCRERKRLCLAIKEGVHTPSCLPVLGPRISILGRSLSVTLGTPGLLCCCAAFFVVPCCCACARRLIEHVVIWRWGGGGRATDETLCLSNSVHSYEDCHRVYLEGWLIFIQCIPLQSLTSNRREQNKNQLTQKWTSRDPSSVKTTGRIPPVGTEGMHAEGSGQPS